MDNDKNEKNINNKYQLIAEIYINNCVKEKMNEKAEEREKRSSLFKTRHKEKMEFLNSSDEKLDSSEAINLEESAYKQKQNEIEKERVSLQDYKTKYFDSIKNDYENSLLRKISKKVSEKDIDFNNEQLLREYIRVEFNNSFDEETDLNNINNLKSFQYTQLADAFKNAFCTEGEDRYPTTFSDEEKEVIRTLYASKISDEQKEIYPLNAITRIVVITSYSDVDYFVNNEKTFQFMPPEDLFWIKSTLRKKAIVLYGYNDIFDVESDGDIKEFPLSVRTEDNHFKAVMFIDNTNMRTFEETTSNEEETEEDIENAKNLVAELDEQKYPESDQNIQDTYTLQQLPSSKISELQNSILKYVRGYHNAIYNMLNETEELEEFNEYDGYNESNDSDNTDDFSNRENTKNGVNEIVPSEKESPSDALSPIKDTQDEANEGNKDNNKINSSDFKEEISDNDIIFIPVKNLIYATPARIYIGVIPKDSTDNKKVIFYLENKKDVYQYKGKMYFKVIGDYYNYVELVPAPKEGKVKFKPSIKRVSEQFLRDNFMVVNLPRKEIVNG